jgi:hypothetical protein
MIGCVGCASNGTDGTRTSSRRVTAKVVNIDAQPSTAPVSGLPPSSVLRAPTSTADHQDPMDVPREVPVVTTTTEERGGSRVVQEEQSGRPQPVEAQPSSAAELPSLHAEEQFLLRVAWDRPAVPLDGTINGEPAVVGYIGGEQGCSRLGVTYPGRRVSEVWRVCADRQFTVDRKAEPTPSVPDDPGVEASRMFAIQSAYQEGRASMQFGPWSISAQSGGLPDARGCVLIRSALSWQGLPVATRDETICRPVEE